MVALANESGLIRTREDPICYLLGCAFAGGQRIVDCSSTAWPTSTGDGWEAAATRRKCHRRVGRRRLRSRTTYVVHAVIY